MKVYLSSDFCTDIVIHNLYVFVNFIVIFALCKLLILKSFINDVLFINSFIFLSYNAQTVIPQSQYIFKMHFPFVQFLKTIFFFNKLYLDY